MQSPNTVSLDFRSYDEDSRDTEIEVNINAEGVNDSKLMRVLNTWLTAIDAKLKVVPNHTLWSKWQKTFGLYLQWNYWTNGSLK